MAGNLDPRNLILAQRAKAAGANWSLRIILEARKRDLPLSLAFAMVEQESNFRNVYGHDLVLNRAPKGAPVTKSNYQGTYLPDRKAGKGMQGVGPLQLTWWEFQDEADRRGGCWVPKHNISVAFDMLSSSIAQHGLKEGIMRYNGRGPAAERYYEQVAARTERWHKILTKGD
jgi:hypothetical protein